MKLIWIIRAASVFVLGCFASSSWAGEGWSPIGQVAALSYGLNGNSPVVELTNQTKSDCTCYAGWNNSFCLNPARNTYKAELAALMAAQMTKQRISVYIDGACLISGLQAFGN